jgi:hypothetical protein
MTGMCSNHLQKKCVDTLKQIAWNIHSCCLVVFVVNIFINDLSNKFMLELMSFAKKALHKVIASSV